MMSESDEMRPVWWEEDQVPYRDMWLDDELWYPHMFANNKFKAYFLFKGHEKILSHTIELLKAI